MGDEKSILQVDDVSVAYGSTIAVRDVSLAIQAHQIIGIFGPNGAGKSSLLKGIAGLVKTKAGQITLEGENVSRRGAESRARRGVVLVPEGRGIFAPMTVNENLRLGAYPSGTLGRHDLGSRLDDAFDLFPVLKERRAQIAGTLSGGEAAMLAIARGLMSRPRVLLLDEPSLGLAPAITSRLFERLALLRQTGIAMIVVEQRAAELTTLADMSVVLRHGREQYRSDGAIDMEDFNRMYFGDTATSKS